MVKNINDIINIEKIFSHSRKDIEFHLNEKINFSNLNEQSEFMVVRFYELGYLKTIKSEKDFDNCIRNVNQLLSDFKNKYGYNHRNDRELYLFYSEIIFKLLEFYNLKSQEYIQQQRERLYKELNNPKEFKPHLNFMRKLIKRNHKK